MLLSQGRPVADAIRTISVTAFAEARIVIEGWRQHYNTRRTHSSLGYRPPAPLAVVWPAAPTQSASPATSTVVGKPTMH